MQKFIAWETRIITYEFSILIYYTPERIFVC